MPREWNPYSAGKCTRWQDDEGREFLIPSSQTTGFRCTVLNLRQPPLICDGKGSTKPMARTQWKRWQPKLRRAFHALYDDYLVPEDKRTGKGKRVETLKRYQHAEG